MQSSGAASHGPLLFRMTKVSPDEAELPSADAPESQPSSQPQIASPPAGYRKNHAKYLARKGARAALRSTHGNADSPVPPRSPASCPSTLI